MAERAPISKRIWAQCGKRVFDAIGAAVLVVLLSPLLLMCALLIKLTSRGPVFFMQVRSGREGVEFRPFKFRTMRGGRKPDPKELVPLHHPEITAVGRALRRLKLDELPQLLNVLKGEMSLVGPRPTLPDQVAAYDAFKRQRMLVRPGLTGLAQVNSSASSSWDERIKYDVYYVQHHGLWMDVGILLKTPLVMLRGEERFARSFDQSPYGRKRGNGDQGRGNRS
jgi:lipopolysaccharide/colanic/teichoic acid biosynthesis glycosyltransferase